MSHDCVLAVMARSPFAAAEAIKTRLAKAVPLEADRRNLYRAFLTDMLATCRQIPGISLRLAYTPEGGAVGLTIMGLRDDELIPQRGDDLGERERSLFEDLFDAGFDRAVIVGSDLPTLPGAHIATAINELRASQGIVILGPSDDGGYHLMGLNAPAKPSLRAEVPDLFSGIRWSSEWALEDTIAAAHRAGLEVRFAPRWYDVDDESGLTRLREELRDPEAAARAPATAAALAKISGEWRT